MTKWVCVFFIRYSKFWSKVEEATEEQEEGKGNVMVGCLPSLNPGGSCYQGYESAELLVFNVVSAPDINKQWFKQLHPVQGQSRCSNVECLFTFYRLKTHIKGANVSSVRCVIMVVAVIASTISPRSNLPDRVNVGPLSRWMYRCHPCVRPCVIFCKMQWFKN